MRFAADIEWGSVAEWAGAIATFAAVIVSLWLARKGDRDASARDLRLRRGSAQKTLSKLLVIINSLYAMDRYFKEAQENADSDLRQNDRWKYTKGMAGLTTEGDVQFDGDEVGLFLDAGETQFAMDLTLLARRHAAGVEIMKDYRRSRDLLLKSLPAPIEVDGCQAGVELSREQLLAVAPYAAGLEEMLRSMIVHTAADLTLAYEVADRFGPICQRYFNDSKFPGLRRPAETKETPSID